MVDGIATSLIPLTTSCNFRLHPVEHGAFQNSAAAKCRVFWPFMQRERVPNDHLTECGQQNLDSECVLLIEGKIVRRLLSWRTMIQQNFRERSAGQDVQRYVCCGKSEADGETGRKPC
jgi:hypothetical protein